MLYNKCEKICTDTNNKLSAEVFLGSEIRPQQHEIAQTCNQRGFEQMDGGERHWAVTVPTSVVQISLCGRMNHVSCFSKVPCTTNTLFVSWFSRLCLCLGRFLFSSSRLCAHLLEKIGHSQQHARRTKGRHVVFQVCMYYISHVNSPLHYLPLCI